MDFSLILTLLLAVSGLILMTEAPIFKRRQRVTRNTKERPLTQYARSFVVEPFRIPSASMMPGLVDGDFIFVNKFSYGLRLPIVNIKFMSTDQPKRGDVIVLRLPSDRSTHLIKRLIGLPGDNVVVHDNALFINGARVQAKRNGEYTGDYGFSGADLAIERIDDRDHLIMLAHRMSTDYEAVVPPDSYFFMGDNRNDSEDSRFAQAGFVPDKNLDGRAMLIWMNWKIPGWPIWRRFGTRIT